MIGQEAGESCRYYRLYFDILGSFNRAHCTLLSEMAPDMVSNIVEETTDDNPRESFCTLQWAVGEK